MGKHIYIIGESPVAECLIRQFEDEGYAVKRQEKLLMDDININDFDELCLLHEEKVDNKAVMMLGELAAKYDVEAHNGKRLLCHLLVQRNETFRMLQTCDLCDAIRQKADVYPFTIDEAWSRSIVLDYEPITIHSDKHVHLVIFGMGEVAETMAKPFCSPRLKIYNAGLPSGCFAVQLCFKTCGCAEGARLILDEEAKY